MDTFELYLGLGSNLGDRSANIKKAISSLDKAFCKSPTAVSSLIETKSWGFDGPDFLNCVVRYDFEVKPAGAEEILFICKRVESELGRTPEQGTAGGVFKSRPIDVDILFYGLERIDLPVLKVPHLHMRERDFVMIPLCEIASERIKAAFGDIFGRKRSSGDGPGEA
ncbi:MAG: 2-amino-4-hydroxy-6-hydroxymethyldihydropteridine diphosphokinase [Candidatus Cryptobacteroides sp.]